MAELKKGQTAEYWYKRSEKYRRQLGGVNAANSKLKQKLKEKDCRIKELEQLLSDRHEEEAERLLEY